MLHLKSGISLSTWSIGHSIVEVAAITGRKSIVTRLCFSQFSMETMAARSGKLFKMCADFSHGTKLFSPFDEVLQIHSLVRTVVSLAGLNRLCWMLDGNLYGRGPWQVDLAEVCIWIHHDVCSTIVEAFRGPDIHIWPPLIWACEMPTECQPRYRYRDLYRYGGYAWLPWWNRSAGRYSDPPWRERFFLPDCTPSNPLFFARQQYRCALYWRLEHVTIVQAKSFQQWST